jgi:hypothetical protein
MVATIKLLLETAFPTRSIQRGYKEDYWGDPVSWELSFARKAEKRWWFSSVDSSLAGYLLESNDVSTEAEESPLLRSVTKQQLAKTLQAGKDLECDDLESVEISSSVIVICSYNL